MDSRVQPQSVILRRQDDRHPVMDGPHQRVGFSDDDGAGFQRLAVLFPAFPETGEGEGAGGFQADEIRLFGGFGVRPLVKPIGDDQAAAMAEGRMGLGDANTAQSDLFAPSSAGTPDKSQRLMEALDRLWSKSADFR